MKSDVAKAILDLNKCTFCQVHGERDIILTHLQNNHSDQEAYIYISKLQVI